VQAKKSGTSSLPDDENDWKMRYPPYLVGWLVDMLESVDWQLSVMDILTTEQNFPGLMDDMSLEIWQRRLIEKQLEGSKS
jgi:hypothetical protein